MPKIQTLTSVELFTGAGGLALGIAKSGFEHLRLVEWNKDACASLEANVLRIPEMRHWPRPIEPTDVRHVDFKPLRDRVTLLAAGAPCQPFSLGGKHRGDEDERNMFPSVFHAVRELRPQAVVVENVKGLLRSSFADYFRYIGLQLSFPEIVLRPREQWRAHLSRLLRAEKDPPHIPALQYKVTHQLLNAANYGLPQKRERVFILAFRSDVGASWRPLKATHTEAALLFAQWVTGEYWKEHGIRAPRVPPNLVAKVRRLRTQVSGLFETPPLEERWRTVRDALRDLPTPINGIEHPTISNHVGNPGARSYPGHTGSGLDGPAKTLKAGDHGVPGGENTLRDERGRVRYLTVREAARLQGFPDEYRFQGAWGEGFRQLGNAVPVGLARAVAEAVKARLQETHSRKRVA